MRIPVTTGDSGPSTVLVRKSSLAPSTLTHADRCDSTTAVGARHACGARAYVAAMFSVPRNGLLPLYFCAHHFQEAEATIRDRAVMVVDERFQLHEGVKAQKRDVASWLTATPTRGA